MVIIYLDDETRGKVLEKKIATSIMADNSLLENNNLLERIASCRDNVYYHVKGTNAVIMHVEEGFNILCDYTVNGKCLPEIMKEEHYAVYQLNGRDWIKNSATGRYIGYDIKEIVTGQSGRPKGTTLDHEAETFDEREKNKMFKTNNFNNGSHRVRVEIRSQEELNDLINKITHDDNTNHHGGMYIK